MQNVRILVDGREVYKGEIDENAKIDIQKQESYTRDNPKDMTLQDLIDGCLRYSSFNEPSHIPIRAYVEDDCLKIIIKGWVMTGKQELGL